MGHRRGSAAATGKVLVAALLAGLALVAGPRHPASAEASASVDLLAGDLDSLAGSIRTPEGLRVAHRGFRIVRQDGGGGQANPPWNLAGTHLRVGRQVALELGLSGMRGQAAVLLAGRPPIVYDEFLHDRGSVRVSLGARRISVRVVGGQGAERVRAYRSWRRPSGGSSLHMGLRVRGGALLVSADGVRLGRVPLHHALAGGALWFGFDAADPGGRFDVHRFTATAPAGEPLAMVDVSPFNLGAPSTSGLAAQARSRRPDFHLGAALSLSSLASDPAFARLALGGDFDAITTENALKFQFVHPLPGVYDFHEADALVAAAQDNGLAIHGHALAFGEANPRWLQRFAQRHPDRMAGLLRRHVRTVVGRYAGRVASWDVVNEPLAAEADRSGLFGLRRSIWQRAIGPRFIEIALRAAHHADPDAKLFINEFGLEAHDQRWREMRALLRRLRADGVPVHGVGLQAHVYEPGDEIRPALLRAVFADLAELGMVARISELDVYGSRTRAQARQFAAVLRTCLAAPTCRSLTTWGVSERYGSTSYLDRGRLRLGDGLPWDAELRPLPAVAAMRAAIASVPATPEPG